MFQGTWQAKTSKRGNKRTWSWCHETVGVIASLRLEKTFKIIESNCYSSTAKSTKWKSVPQRKGVNPER